MTKISVSDVAQNRMKKSYDSRYSPINIGISETGLQHLVQCINKNDECTIRVGNSLDNSITLLFTDSQIKKIAKNEAMGKNTNIKFSKSQLKSIKSASGLWDDIKNAASKIGHEIVKDAKIVGQKVVIPAGKFLYKEVAKPVYKNIVEPAVRDGVKEGIARRIGGRGVGRGRGRGRGRGIAGGAVIGRDIIEYR